MSKRWIKSKIEERNQERGYVRMYREDALRKQNMCCYYCLNPLTFQNATADHLHPRCKGGDSRKDNIVASCQECNTCKSIFDKYISADVFRNMVRSPPKEITEIKLFLAHFRFRLWSKVHAFDRRLQKVTYSYNEYR
jgi:hypothetical protein